LLTMRLQSGGLLLLVELMMTCIRLVHADCSECVSNSECVEGQCRCQAGYTGHGDFFCADLATHKCCCGNSDPVLVTEDGSSVVYNLLGSTHLVELTTGRVPLLGGPPGECHFKLWGWTERHLGKMYYAGLAFQIDQVTSASNVTERGHLHGAAQSGAPYDFSFRITGVNVYQGDDDLCGIQFRLINWNFLRAKLPCCGIQFAIRPYHPDYPHRTPGYWFTVEKDEESTFMPSLFKNEPQDGGICVSTHSLLNFTGLTNIRHAASFYAMTNSDLSDYPSTARGLGDMKAVMRNCPRADRDELMRVVDLFFIPHLMKCLNGVTGKSVDNTIQAITDAGRYICQRDVTACHKMAALLQGHLATCARVIQDFPDIGALAFSYCP